MGDIACFDSIQASPEHHPSLGKRKRSGMEKKQKNKNLVVSVSQLSTYIVVRQQLGLDISSNIQITANEQT